MGVDAVAVAAALVLTPGSAMLTPTFAVALLAVGAAMATVLGGLGAYRSRLTMSVLDDLPGLGAAAVVGTVIGSQLAGAPVALLAGVLLTLLVLVRAGAYAVVRSARRRGVVAHRTLVIGAGEVGQQLATAALEHPEHGLLPIGFLDDVLPTDARDLPVPHLGGSGDLVDIVQREGVGVVVVAWGRTDDSVLVDELRECDRLHTEIFTVPRLFELQHQGRDTDELWGIPLVRMRRAAWRSGSWPAKRAFDVLVAATALVVFGPLMIAAAIGVRMELGKDILFRQVRVGVDGKPFTILKFRTLSLPTGPDAQPVWSINGDARLGPVGRFLRSTSIDELPQLINVLRGEMSIVGPRPERQVFVDQFSADIPRYHHRHRAPVGLTGWAQVNGLRGDTSIADRSRFDNNYIQSWSLWLDLKIIARTVGTVLLRRGS